MLAWGKADHPDTEAFSGDAKNGYARWMMRELTRALKLLGLLVLSATGAVAVETIADNRTKFEFEPRKPFIIYEDTIICVDTDVSLLLRVNNILAQGLGSNGHLNGSEAGLTLGFSSMLGGHLHQAGIRTDVDSGSRITSRDYSSSDCKAEHDLNVHLKYSLTEEYKLYKIVAQITSQDQFGQVIIRHKPVPRRYGPFADNAFYGFEAQADEDEHDILRRIVSMIDETSSTKLHKN